MEQQVYSCSTHWSLGHLHKHERLLLEMDEWRVEKAPRVK